MSFDEGRIILDKDSGVYNAGDVIHGKIVFDQGRPQHVNGIYVHWTGFCKVQWTKSKEIYEGYEEYINNEFYIFGDGKGNHELSKGHHEFSFNCPIPSTCPSSFDGKHGHIRYEIKVIMVKPGTREEKSFDITVHAPMDMNENPYCKEPIENTEEHKILKWCCMKAGYLKTVISIEKGGYMPGDTIPVLVNAENRSSGSMLSICVVLTKVTKYTTQSKAEIKEDTESLTISQNFRKLKPRTKYNQKVDVFVPAMETHNLMGCRLISIEYFVNLVVIPSSVVQLALINKAPIIIASCLKEPQEDSQHLHSKQQLPNSTCQSNFFQIMPYPTPSNMH